MNTIHAIYEGGVFRPLEPVDLAEKSEVEFEPRVVKTHSILDIPSVSLGSVLRPFDGKEDRLDEMLEGRS